MRRTWLAMLLALGAFGVIDSTGAQASCAMPRPLPEMLASAPLVFVGTVVSTSDGDRVARVKVESIWKGPNLPAVVEVHGSPASGWGAATSVDRHYRAGERDLFVLYSDQQPYQDNNCSATQPYSAQVAVLAPSDVRSPAPLTTREQVQNLVSQYWLSIAIAVVVVAIAVVAYMSVRRPRPSPQ
jgi:hypothetical protein